ncbi:hypothetical protein [Albibacillus kandeliae]|uniref:hypothetical protein n=1 Tax=Albibacillus kandeliae TaxID=2174228 RepID=UPI000D6904D9|nr:hypothetical protein [Albibacillus kandeliae]
MSNQKVTTQANLIYASLPGLDFDRILLTLNGLLRRLGMPSLALSPMSSDRFALFSNETLHASIALHEGPLGEAGFERALAAPMAEPADIATMLRDNRAHVQISVGDGPTPVAFAPPTPVDITVRVEALQNLIKLVHAAAACKAAHVCSSDRFLMPEDISGFGTALAPAMLVHPAPVGERTGPYGQSGSGMIAHQSRLLIGKTLVLEGIPTDVPNSMRLLLLDTLLNEHMRGRLTLEDGDRLTEVPGLTLYIRHDTAHEQIIASFWSAPPATGSSVPERIFLAHPGYGATQGSSDSTESEEDWLFPETASSRVAAPTSSGAFPSWMILVAIGLFLWVGLPLLNIPQKVIESAFSNGIDGVEMPD